MSGSAESPFGNRSNKTERTPTKVNIREPSLIRSDRTRSQSLTDRKEAGNTSNATTFKSDTQKTKQKLKQKEVNKAEGSSTLQANKTELEKSLQKSEIATTTSEALEKSTVRTQKVTMNQRQIQQLIADNAIPEFSGEDETNGTSKLTRFIGIADSVYVTLGTEAEKKLFTQLLKFKLTGDAFTRISYREIDEYNTLKSLLSSMYGKTFTLNELEREFMNVQQAYGETVRNYGYRLIEALDRYKNGYKNKYAVLTLDTAYITHLDATAVQSFKRGLNNVILREKIATVRVNNVDEIVNEAEGMEQMLMMSIGRSDMQTTQNYRSPDSVKWQQQIPQIPNYQGFHRDSQSRPSQIICNYCQKPNHTYDVCRTRLATQRNTQFTNYSPRQNFNSYSRNKFTPNTSQTTQNSFTPQRVPSNVYQNQIQNSFTQYRQPQQRNSYAPKYCSHCKITTGHTFDECRSKFLGQRTYETNNYPRQQQQPNNYSMQQSQQPQQQTLNDLEEKIKNMRINQIAPQQQVADHQSYFLANQRDQGNANGST